MNLIGQYKGIPAQTESVLHKYLYDLGTQWLGKGVAMELGSWLGGSALPLLEGLKMAGYDLPFWAFDNWNATRPQVIQAAQQKVIIRLMQDLRPLFLKNILPVCSEVNAIRGTLPQTLKQYDGDPIEICIFDAPKKDHVFSDCIRALSKYWIPEVTILGLLDYNFYKSKEGRARKASLAPVKWLEKNRECFTDLWENGSVKFLRYEKELANV